MCSFSRAKRTPQGEAVITHEVRITFRASGTHRSKNEKSTSFEVLFSFLVAEMGFEPHDLRVMSPTSYQTAPLRDIVVPEAGVEPVREKISRDFKSRASANSAIPACFLDLLSKLPYYSIISCLKSQYLNRKYF